MSQRHDELEAMTELAAFLMALMLTVELGLAIAFVAAWLTARQPGESDPPTLKKTPGSAAMLANDDNGSKLVWLNAATSGGTMRSLPSPSPCAAE
jgi:hypothetical protein